MGITSLLLCKTFSSKKVGSNFSSFFPQEFIFFKTYPLCGQVLCITLLYLFPVGSFFLLICVFPSGKRKVSTIFLQAVYIVLHMREYSFVFLYILWKTKSSFINSIWLWKTFLKNDKVSLSEFN